MLYLMKADGDRLAIPEVAKVSRRIRRADRVVSYNGLVVVQLKNGDILLPNARTYTTITNRRVLSLKDQTRNLSMLDSLLNALVILGVLKEEQIKDHLAEVTEAWRSERHKRDIDYHKNQLEKLAGQKIKLKENLSG
tara:strand:- start:2819 stop:3229 length:411 start_codon:yes stop_codon:yes gene_type:complete